MDIANATGHKVFTLAFVLADSTGCNPSWGGTIPLDDPRIIGDIRALQAMGGEVIVATGGAAGPYLEYTCGSADALAGAYREILDTVGTNHLDVDVEATIPQDTVNQALKTVQDERGTSVSYTMRVLGDDYGMDPYSVQVLQSAAAHGVDVLVNPMTMEFGTSRPDWGDAVIAAAESSLRQMREIWPNDANLARRLGVTPMIGRNYNGKIFDTATRDSSWTGPTPTTSGWSRSGRRAATTGRARAVGCPPPARASPRARSSSPRSRTASPASAAPRPAAARRSRRPRPTGRRAGPRRAWSGCRRRRPRSRRRPARRPR